MDERLIVKVSQKDYLKGTIIGFLIGLLLMPVLKAAQPVLYEQLKLILVPFFTVGAPLGLFIAYEISRKIPLVWQIAKFALIGVLNTLVDLGVLSLLIFLFRALLDINPEAKIALVFGLSLTCYSFYKATSFIIANVNSYVWNKYWTFKQNENKKTFKEFLQFFIVSLIGFVINVFSASYVFNYISAPIGLNSDQWGLIGAIVGSIAGLTWNFIGYKFIVFKK